MNMLHVDFQDLYERHLCRHSEFGINVGHLSCVVGTYLALFGIAYALTQAPLLILGLTLPYLAVLAFNVAARVFAVTVLFMAAFFAGFFYLPVLPIWAYVAIIYVLYKIQNWSHRYWRAERDMTEFNKKYPKGVTLFFLLLLYELPLLLNYLCFAGAGGEWAGQPARQEVAAAAASADPIEITGSAGAAPTHGSA